MAFGDGQPQEVNAGIAAQPLVTSPDRSITDQSAVDRMAEAFRNGFITTQDIMRNVGMSGPRKKAEAQQLSEFVNPEVVASRMEQARAVGAQAKLAHDQAAAELPLVQPAAELKGAEIEKAQAGVWQQEALAAYQQRGYRPIYKEDGSLDTDKMAVVGRDLVDANIRMTYAQSMLAGKWSQETHGKEVVQVLRNSLGEDVTPDPKNPTVKYYQKMMQDARKTLFQPLKEPDDRTVGRALPAEAGTSTAAVTPRTVTSTVEPGLAKKDIDTFRSLVTADLIKNGVPDGASIASGMTDQDLLDYAADNLAKKGESKKMTVHPDGRITVEGPAEAPPVEPIAGDFAPPGGFGYRTPKPGYYGTPEEISTALMAAPAVKQWNDAKGTINAFISTAAAATANPSAGDDQKLAMYVAQLADPSSNGVNYDFSKLLADKPLAEEIGRIWSKTTGTSGMSDGARKRLIEAGHRLVRAKEDAARPSLQLAYTRWDALPEDRKGPVLDAADLRVLNGRSAAAPAGSQRSLPPGAKFHTQGGRDGYVLNGQFFAYK